MSTLTEIQQLIGPELKQLNELIASTLSSPNKMMNQIIDNYLLTKGKQIRPILVILSAKLLGDVNDKVISAAASVELLHNATLIHDDVVDETRTRRGQPTINGVWDNNIAVLIGDFFVSSSLQKALDTADLRVVSAIARLGRMLSIGELDQLYNARNHNISEETYFKTIERKTASLFMACVEMGGYASGADDEDIAAVAEFARALGLCFQIRDDIFDYFDNPKIGKPTGNDLREGKITLPLLYALTLEDTPKSREMLELARKESLTPEEIGRLIAFARENGGIEYAYSTMERIRNGAVTLLDRFDNREVARLLIDLFDYTIAREA